MQSTMPIEHKIKEKIERPYIQLGQLNEILLYLIRLTIKSK